MRRLRSIEIRTATSIGLALFGLLLFTGPAARASTLTVFPAPNVVLGFANTSGVTTGTNLTGTAIIADATASHFAYLSDLGAPPNQNTVLFGLNLTGTESVGVLFDPGTLTISNGGLNASLLGLVSPLTPVTDPVLELLLSGSGIDQFDFSLIGSFTQFGITVSTYSLVGVEVAGAPTSVPEPSPFPLVLAGLTVGLALRLRGGDTAAGRESPSAALRS